MKTVEFSRADICVRLLAMLALVLSGFSGCGQAEPAGTDEVANRRMPGQAQSATESKPLVSSPGVEPTVLRFSDIASTAGLTITHREADDGRFRLVETMGSGVALFDMDNDGDLDLFIGQGGQMPPDFKNPQWASQLYRNDGGGKYTDISVSAGIAFGRYVQGVATGDYDGDGRIDLFIAGFDRSALFRNVDGKHFEDASKKAGVEGSGWPSSCSFADLDADGDLDLFVVHYLANTVDASGEPTVRCNGSPGKLGYCPPNAFAPEANVLYRNNGDGTFTDISTESGITSVKGNGLGLAIADFDDDGRLDLFVANDQTPNFLYHNLGGLKFEEVGLAWGVALSENGQTRAGMGVAAGDADGDGKIDLCVTNFYEEGVTLYKNLGEGRFQVATAPSRLLVPTRSKLGFGAGFVDFDNDGWLDLYLANGHINDVTPLGMPYRMESQVFRNAGGGRFQDHSAHAGPYFLKKQLARSAAFGDIDNDGDVDVLVSHIQGPPALLRNESEVGQWLSLSLRSKGKCGSPIGARVTATVAGRVLVRWVVGGGSYLAASDTRVSLGLGTAKKVEKLEIRWISGAVQTFENVDAGQSLSLVEGEMLEPAAKQ